MKALDQKQPKEKNSNYAARINRVCDYIQANLDEDLPVETLCRVANFSRFHFHRLFSSYCKISVGKYVLMARFKRASYQLAFRAQLSITDIALDAKFENPESFSRAFKSKFGQTPSQFRRNPDWESWEQKYQFRSHYPHSFERELMMDVQIIDFPETKVAVLEHRGAPALVNQTAGAFIEWRKTTGLSPVASSRTFGLAYNDPSTTEPEDFRWDVCGSVKEDVPNNPQGVINKFIPAGRCAHICHQGARDKSMEDKVRYLYEEWLHNADETLRDFPCFFEYQNLFPEVPEHELMTDIYLPLQ